MQLIYNTLMWIHIFTSDQHWTAILCCMCIFYGHLINGKFRNAGLDQGLHCKFCFINKALYKFMIDRLDQLHFCRFFSSIFILHVCLKRNVPPIHPPCVMIQTTHVSCFVHGNEDVFIFTKLSHAHFIIIIWQLQRQCRHCGDVFVTSWAGSCYLSGHIAGLSMPCNSLA